MKRVLLVEDQGWLLEDLSRLLGGGDGSLEVAAACESGEAALDAMERGATFDLALVDLGLPGISGVELIRSIRRLRPDAVSVAFTIFDDNATVFDALRAGARGYLLKSTPPSGLRPALLEAAEGGAPMTPSIARRVVELVAKSPDRHAESVPAPSLTARERDVLSLLAKGHTYQDAATALDIRLTTVQTHVKSIYSKLEVASKAEAVAVALRLGLE